MKQNDDPMVRVVLKFRQALMSSALLLLMPVWVHAQRGTGELHLHVTDQTGAALEALGSLESRATRVRRDFATDTSGGYVATDLPFGIYRLEVQRAGFTPVSVLIDVRSEIPLTYPVTLGLAPIRAVVNVQTVETATLLDPYRAGAANLLGVDLLRDRPSAAPGRSIVDLVNTQPGWLLEANGVLHARGSEYHIQYVVDGIPLRDNRSPAFAPSLEVQEFESMTVRTGGYPAEFGGKLGGVIETNAVRDSRQGFHGLATLQSGSFSALSGSFFGHYVKNGISGGFSTDGLRTDRYLDPPNEANGTNHGSGTGFSGRFERRWTDDSRTRAYVGHRNIRFLVPNETLQEEAGQRQERTTGELFGYVSHRQALSSNVLASVGIKARRVTADLSSNERSTPIRPSQQRGLDETYLNGSLSVHHLDHEVKFGGEATFGSIRENFASTIVVRQLDSIRLFDPVLPASFSFADRRPDLEQSLFVQDLVRFGPLTLSAGVRYDHYRLMVDENAVSPRVAGSWFVAPARLVVHASYDRIFETPAVENVILASSDLVEQLGGAGRSLTLRSSRGNFFEAGFSKELFGRARFDGNYFLRKAHNFADDDLLLNTGVSFPIAFSEAKVSGYEAKLEIPRWGPFAGSFSYSNSVGVGRLPISGGLFLGEGVDALLNSSGQFDLSQDQRNTFRARMRYQVGSRVWLAGAARFDSGLPVVIEDDIDVNLLIQQYGRRVVDRVDFERGRVKASSSLDASVGVNLRNWGPRSLRLQGDVFNLADRLNVINFAGLFSGTAVGPRRTVAVRLDAEF